MRQYEVFELSFSGEEPAGSRTDAVFSAEFEMNGKTVSVGGFYAGNGCYKVRYYPAQTGLCRWRVTGIPGMDASAAGEEICLPATEENHGMVRAEGLHFRYEDGKPYLPFGTTVYAMIHQNPELIRTTMHTLAEAPFNKVRFCVFPKHYSFNSNEPPYFAFERSEDGFDYDRPCYPFWDALETSIRRLGESGIQADLILFHPYDCWGFSRMSREESMKYLGYLVRRLTAFPNVWWSLANEYDLMNHFEPERWKLFSEFLGKNDLYGHLLSNHNFSTAWDFSDTHTTHCCLQASEGEKIPYYQKKFGKPVILDEMGYEGNIPYNWGNLSAFQLVHRFWNAVCHGGYATHGETFMERMDDEQVLWWSKGGILKGKSPVRIAFLRKLLESFPGIPEMYEPKTERSFETQEELRQLIEKKTPGVWDNDVLITISRLEEAEFERIRTYLAEPVIHWGDKAFLKYFGEMCTIYGEINLPQDQEYRIEILDIWEMTRTAVCENAHGKVSVTLPGKAGIALLATRTGGNCTDD